VVLANTELEVGPDEAPLRPKPVYYRGRIAAHFKLEDARGPGVFSVEKGSIPTPNMYQLRRQDEAKPLDENVWKIDFNDDGDTTDSNAVFSVTPGDMGNTSLWKQFDVVVLPNYVWGSSRAESDLFIKDMSGLMLIDGKGVSYQDSMLLQNRPMQRSQP
jgi:hypothetical protein